MVGRHGSAGQASVHARRFAKNRQFMANGWLYPVHTYKESRDWTRGTRVGNERRGVAGVAVGGLNVRPVPLGEPGGREVGHLLG